jgi:hypothetical protein
MAPQRLEKIESGRGNGMGSEASNPQDVEQGARLTVRDSGRRAARMTTLIWTSRRERLSAKQESTGNGAATS